MAGILRGLLICAASQAGRVLECGGEGVQLLEGGRVLRRLEEGGTGGRTEVEGIE